MKLKFISLVNNKSSFVEELSSYAGYSIEREDYKNINLSNDVYYLVSDEQSLKIVNQYNCHKMIVYGLRPTGPITLLARGFKPIVGIKMTNDGNKSSFFGMKFLINVGNYTIKKTIDDDYCFFESKEHTTLFPMLIEYLERHQEYLNIGKN